MSFEAIVDDARRTTDAHHTVSFLLFLINGFKFIVRGWNKKRDFVFSQAETEHQNEA